MKLTNYTKNNPRFIPFLATAREKQKAEHRGKRWGSCQGKSIYYIHVYILDQFSSVPQSYPTLCDPVDCSTPGLPVHHQLPEPTQTHVHPVSDAIQLPHILLSPSPPTFHLS